MSVLVCVCVCGCGCVGVWVGVRVCVCVCMCVCVCVWVGGCACGWVGVGGCDCIRIICISSYELNVQTGSVLVHYICRYIHTYMHAYIRTYNTYAYVCTYVCAYLQVPATEVGDVGTMELLAQLQVVRPVRGGSQGSPTSSSYHPHSTWSWPEDTTTVGTRGAGDRDRGVSLLTKTQDGNTVMYQHVVSTLCVCVCVCLGVGVCGCVSGCGVWVGCVGVGVLALDGIENYN